MTVITFLQIAFSRPMWEGSGTHLRVATHGRREPRRAPGQTFCFRKSFDIPWKIFPIVPFPERISRFFLVINQHFSPYFPCFIAFLSRLCPISNKFLSFFPFYY